MNYRILGKAIFKTLAWVIGGGIVIVIGAVAGAILHDLTKPWQGLIMLVIMVIICIGISIHDIYKKMIKKNCAGAEDKYWDPPL